MINKIEALADAIGELNSIHNPESKAYQLRNPLMLKSYAKLGRHEVNSDGLRVFTSMLAGLKAALFDLDLKIKGLSRAGLKPTDTLKNLLGCYGIHETVAHTKVVRFLRRALADDSVSVTTPLSWFLEGAIDGR